MSKVITLISILYILSIVEVSFSQPQGCCQNNQIQVAGQGIASALPDTATINLSFNEKGRTSAEAVKALSSRVNQVLAILNANGLNSNSYETGSINVFPQFGDVNGQSQIIGQQASQSITVKVRNIDAAGRKVGTIVDALAVVNNININSVTFDIFDKTALQAQARTNAFQNAKNKAQDYASFAGLNVGRVLTIDDQTYVEAPPVVARKDFAVAALAISAPSTVVPVGSQDVSYRTTITFALN